MSLNYLAVHPQTGYGRGVGEEEINHRAEDADLAVALREPGQGCLYGGEETWDCIIIDERKGQIHEETADSLASVSEQWTLGGMYGSECVFNAAERLPDPSIDAETTVDQEFGGENYVVAQKLDGAYKQHFESYLEKFREPETASEYLKFGDAEARQIVEELGSLDSGNLENPESDVKLGMDARYGRPKAFARTI